MNPKDFYERLISSITDMDKRMVARVLSRHIGKNNAIQKVQIVAEVFGEYNQSTERKTRDIIADLVTLDHYPICSISGKGGYYLAENLDEALEAARELEGRATEEFARAKALRLCSLPAVLPEDRAQKAQMSLL
jgi:hypothetical protein